MFDCSPAPPAPSTGQSTRMSHAAQLECLLACVVSLLGTSGVTLTCAGPCVLCPVYRGTRWRLYWSRLCSRWSAFCALGWGSVPDAWRQARSLFWLLGTKPQYPADSGRTELQHTKPGWGVAGLAPGILPWKARQSTHCM